MANTLTRYQPTTNVTRLPDLMTRLFNDSIVVPSWIDSFGGMSRPSLPVNLYETQESYFLYVSLPGMNPQNLDIQVVGRELTIKGRFEIETPQGGTWIWQGIPTGEFFETFTLPVDVQGDKVEATYHHGILHLAVPKAEHVRPKTIKVSVK